MKENALQVMTVCNKKMYPSVFKSFQILDTIPVFTASNESTFPNLKQIISCLRRTLTEVKINYCQTF
jgi:hypothetical protein